MRETIKTHFTFIIKLISCHRELSSVDKDSV